MHAQAGPRRRPMCAQLGLDDVAQPDQHEVNFRRAFLELKCSWNGHMGSVVAPHAIDGNRDVHAGSRPVAQGAATGGQ